MFKIITLEREFGCGGAVLAEQLAARLGWRLYDQQMTDQIAKRANVDPSAVMRCDERLDSRLYRLSKVFWRGSYERSLPLDSPKVFDADFMMTMVRQVMEEAAEQGNCIIVGRGAPFFLRDRADTFRVFLYAPRDEKVRRLIAMGKSLDESNELIDSIDAERIAFIKHYFNADWPTRALYHIMINTAVGNEKVIETILDTMRVLGGVPASRD